MEQATAKFVFLYPAKSKEEVNNISAINNFSYHSEAQMCFSIFQKPFNPIQTGGGELLRPASTLRLCNFVTVYASTTKLRDFS